MAFSTLWQNSKYVLSEYRSKIRPYISQQAKQMGIKVKMEKKNPFRVCASVLMRACVCTRVCG